MMINLPEIHFHKKEETDNKYIYNSGGQGAKNKYDLQGMFVL